MDVKKDTRYLVVTGGVCSSLGKGIVASAFGALFKSAGLKVFNIKLDPYLNVDPGTMNPYRHGEVFVTDDGAETDLDLGHYERFVGEPLSTRSSVTSGQIYSLVIDKERKGEYLGRDVQVIPHVTNEIKDCLYLTAKEENADMVIIEIGGTVGDIEGPHFLEAARQMRLELGPNRLMFIHVTLLPHLKVTGELKTKPTQGSVRELRSFGIQPDVIVARADHEISDEIIDKLSLFCEVPKEAVVRAETVKSIYDVPLQFAKTACIDLMQERLEFKDLEINLEPWQKLSERIHAEKESITLGVVGKYTDLGDSYISIVEAIKSACYEHNRELDLVWVDSEDLEKGDFDVLRELCGILIPGGFGSRGIEGKIKACKFARENKMPYFGICLGMQIMTIEFARSLGIDDANSQEFDESCKDPVIHLMEQQKSIHKKGGTMRLGAYPCVLREGTKTYDIYGIKNISERHRHRFEFNNDYREKLESGGLKISGMSPDENLVEIVELESHPFMLGVQFHPEFLSRPIKPHPLFSAWVKAALDFSPSLFKDI